MVVKKKTAKKNQKKAVKPASKKGVQDEGTSLDDAFADDDDVAYAPSKAQKKKNKGLSEKEIEEEIESIESANNDAASQGETEIKASKPIGQVKKGDIIMVNDTEYEVDAHYVLIDHGSTKEMAIELFDSTSDKEYQLRYFSDQANQTMELYELQEIMYIKKQLKSVAW